ncbi:hypothetical protein C8R43DRAFT_1032819 [Mycena crocata]|nr:hypothetical protein C8R43DRAFT_1032819 [Mycena crocata]
MVFSPLASTFLLLGLVSIAQTTPHAGHTINHRNLAQRVVHPDLVERQPASQKLHRRRSCQTPGSFPVSSAEAASSTMSIDAATAKTTATPNGASKHTTTAADPSTETGSTSSSSSSKGGHQFTLVNKCSSAVKPVVVSTACGYSPRCADATTALLPAVGSLAAGKTTTITIANKFVGRIFAQNGSCGAKGEDCTMLEFNLDADSFYTPNSYDISNIQGFTQSISLGAAGCSSVTCSSADCGCNNAYPVGDMTGCGNDLPVKACGKGNMAFTVVFCP